MRVDRKSGWKMNNKVWVGTMEWCKKCGVLVGGCDTLIFAFYFSELSLVVLVVPSLNYFTPPYIK